MFSELETKMLTAFALSMIFFAHPYEVMAGGDMAPMPKASPSPKAEPPRDPMDVDDPADIAIEATAKGPGNYQWTATASAPPTTVSTEAASAAAKRRAKMDADLMDALGGNISAAASAPTTPTTAPSTPSSPAPPAPPVANHGGLMSSQPHPDDRMKGAVINYYRDGTKEVVQNGQVIESKKMW